jgi:hypothetical protein
MQVYWQSDNFRQSGVAPPVSQWRESCRYVTPNEQVEKGRQQVMHTNSSTNSKRLLTYVAGLLGTALPKRRHAPLAVSGTQPSDHPHLDAHTASGSQTVVVDPATTRKAEIERLLAQSRTRDTAVSFLRGLSTLSAPTPAA